MTSSSINRNEPPESLPVAASRWTRSLLLPSKTIRDIYANMTVAEKTNANRDAMLFGSLYGVWCAISFVNPLIQILLGLIAGNLSPAFAVVGTLLIMAHVACIPFVLRRQRKFLCKTQWARENGIEPDELKLFNWRSQS